MSYPSADHAAADGVPVVTLDNVGKTFATGVMALDRLNLDVRPGEFVTLLGPSGCGKSTALRLIAGLSEPTRGSIDWADKTGAARGGGALGFVFQEPTLMPWATVARNVRLPLKLMGIAENADARVAAALERVGLADFASSLSARTLGRHEDAGVDRAGAGDRAEASADGRAVRGARRDHALPAQQRSAALWQSLGKTVVFVTHSVFESVYLSQRIVVMTARPGRVFTELAIDAPYPRDERFRTSRAICGVLPAGLRGARRRASRPRAERRMSGEPRRRSTAATRDRSTACCACCCRSRCSRWPCSPGIWSCACSEIPPYVLPGPRLVFETLVADWALLSASLLVTLKTTLQGFVLAVVGGVGLAMLFNQSRLIEYSLYPYAVILQVTPIVAIAPLLLIYLPQQAAVLACAWIVAFFPVLANTTLGLNSVDHNLADLFRLYGASRWQVLCGSSCRRRCRISSAA